MTSYRFCRPDDMQMLVHAVNVCWLPYTPGAAPYTDSDFKREVREINLWASSCLVALGKDRSDPVAILMGCKRAHGTLIYRLATRPDCVRQGHASHLLTSIKGKLAVIGPEAIYAELLTGQADLEAFFLKHKFVAERQFVDLVFEANSNTKAGIQPEPITVDEILSSSISSHLSTNDAWDRQKEALINLKEELQGLAIVSDVGIECAVLFRHKESLIEVPFLHTTDQPYGAAILGSLLLALREKLQLTIVIPQIPADSAICKRCDFLQALPKRATLYRGFAETI